MYQLCVKLRQSRLPGVVKYQHRIDHGDISGQASNPDFVVTFNMPPLLVDRLVKHAARR